MSSSKPLKSKNAIDEIAFIVLFEKELDDKTLFSLLELQNEFASTLPSFDIVKVVKMHVDHQNPQMPVTKPGGILCSKPSEFQKDRVEWSVRVESNKILVACSEFDSWERIWPIAKEYLFTTVRKFNLLKNPVKEVVFNCVDKFIYQGDPEGYQVSDVFNLASRFLTKNVIDLNSPSWHIHQGWFLFPSSGTIQALHNLNINVFTPDEKPHETTISHQIKVRRENGDPIKEIDLFLGVDGREGYLERSMVQCHDSNKGVLQGLLCPEMLEAISLEKGAL